MIELRIKSIRPKIITALALLGMMALAVILNVHDLYFPWYQDDFYFLSLGGFTFHKAILNFNPIHISWFYRPLSVDYMLVWNALFPHHNCLVEIHGVALSLFGATSYVVGLIGYKLTKSLWSGALCAAAFLIAPNKDEALWWACCASTLLAGLFSAISVYLWLRYREAPGQSVFLWISIACVVLATLFKEDAFPVPIILLAIDLLVLRPKWNWKTIVPYILLFTWLAVYATLSIIAYNHTSLRKYGYNVGVKNHWDVIVWFTSQRLFFPFSRSLDFELPAAVVLIVGLGCLLFRIWGNRTLIALMLAVIVTAATLPALAGPHGTGGRFNYAPDIYASLLWGIALSLALRSSYEPTRLLGYAFILSLMIGDSYPPLLYPYTAKMLALFGLPLLYLAWRAWNDRRHILALITISQAAAVASLVVLDPLWMALLCGVSALAYISLVREGNIRQRLDACTMSVMAYTIPPWGILLAFENIKQVVVKKATAGFCVRT